MNLKGKTLKNVITGEQMTWGDDMEFKEKVRRSMNDQEGKNRTLHQENERIKEKNDQLQNKIKQLTNKLTKQEQEFKNSSSKLSLFSIVLCLQFLTFSDFH